MNRFLLILLIPFGLVAQGVAINFTGTAPDASAILDVSTTTMGFLLPRLTSAQRDAILNPAQGLIVFNVESGCMNYFFNGQWNVLCGSPAGSVASLNCSSSSHTGSLTAGTAASGVSSSVPYIGGNGGSHSGQVVNSIGVNGLTATLVAGSFASGSGSLTYTISGTPAAGGTADFVLLIGGQTCTLSVNVSSPPSYPAGTVHCTGVPTVIIDVTNPVTGKTWMDRNLGASQVAANSTDAQAYGDLYQWGRRADGHQCRTSPTTTVLSNTDQPSHGNFITTSTTPFDWRSPQNTNLWQGLNGVNNPCPSGYRLPTVTEFNAERLSWSSSGSAGAFASPLKWTLAGVKLSNNGALDHVGSRAYYWSGTPITGANPSHNLYFTSSTASEQTNSRANGMSVRCIRD